jgi:hypothetical protein
MIGLEVDRKEQELLRQILKGQVVGHIRHDSANLGKVVKTVRTLAVKCGMTQDALVNLLDEVERESVQQFPSERTARYRSLKAALL